MDALDEVIAKHVAISHAKSVITLQKGVAEKVNTIDIPQINDKVQYKDVDFTKPVDLDFQYENEIKQAYLNRLREALGDTGTNSAGTKQYRISTARNGVDWTVTTTNIAHDDSSMITLRVSRDSKGHIVSLQPLTPVTHSKDVVLDILEHHGVKGQKWGVRRSAAELSGGRAARKAAKRSPIVTTSHTPGKRVQTVGGKSLPAHEDAFKTAVSKQRAKSSTTDALSNKELKDLVTRMNLEQQYSNLAKGKKSEGQAYIENQLKQAGNQALPKLLAKHGAKVAAAFAVV